MGLPHHDALSTNGTPLACRCSGSNFFSYETPFYDVIGLGAISSLPLVGFCWTGDG